MLVLVGRLNGGDNSSSLQCFQGNGTDGSFVSLFLDVVVATVLEGRPSSPWCCVRGSIGSPVSHSS